MRKERDSNVLRPGGGKKGTRLKRVEGELAGNVKGSC